MWLLLLGFRRNPPWVHYQLLVFQKTLKMSIKGIRVRYVDFLTLLRIFKGTFNVNQNSLGKCKMRVVLLDFQFKIWVEHATNF